CPARVPDSGGGRSLMSATSTRYLGRLQSAAERFGRDTRRPGAAVTWPVRFARQQRNGGCTNAGTWRTGPKSFPDASGLYPRYGRNLDRSQSIDTLEHAAIHHWHSSSVDVMRDIGVAIPSLSRAS